MNGFFDTDLHSVSWTYYPLGLTASWVEKCQLTSWRSVSKKPRTWVFIIEQNKHTNTFCEAYEQYQAKWPPMYGLTFVWGGRYGRVWHRQRPTLEGLHGCLHQTIWNSNKNHSQKIPWGAVLNNTFTRIIPRMSSANGRRCYIVTPVFIGWVHTQNVAWFKFHLTHWGLVTPFGDIDLGQHWLRWWLVAWRHQAITWTNVDLSVRSRGILLRAIL